ncbi:MAG: hypothetical protein OEV81_12235 [Betaproteobacteria bacterium]|nr:hypothetical protein [Betaproteobacteria bacterium]MDH5220215.1 hypothetical protein [Betaproteobacteria bacterium]MDH5350897.1 hypothetical protein [Betaproteobacteria bacterium]
MKRGIAATVLATLFALVAGETLAQQKHKYFFKPPPGTTKFMQTHQMDVGDVSGHQLRLAEAQSTFGDEAPVLDGVKAREIRGILVSDYVGGTGNAFLYRVWALENGDKVYSRMDIMAPTTIGADGARTTSYTAVEKLNGGTGKFKGLRGTLFTTGFSDLKTKTSGTQTEGEYWFEQ